MSAPRIAYLLPDPGIPVGGTKGASVHVAEVCQALASRGAEVTLLAQRVAPGGPRLDPAQELVVLDPGPLPRGEEGEVARIRAGERFAAEAARVLADLRPDLVYERLSLFFPRGRELARKVGAARLVEVNAPVAEERERHFGLRYRGRARADEALALLGASVLAVSRPLATWATALGATRAEVVPNGADPARFDPGVNREASVRLRRGLSLEGCEVVGFCGSLKPWHGVEVLARALKLLAPRHPQARLLVVGDGPRRLELEHLAAELGIADRVISTGAVAPAAVPAHLCAMDVVAAPFLPTDDFYFSPLKVVEAMAAGRAVVASRFDATAEVLEGAGRLVTPGSAAELAEALHELLSLPGELERLGALARERVIAELGWDRVADVVLASAALGALA